MCPALPASQAHEQGRRACAELLRGIRAANLNKVHGLGEGVPRIVRPEDVNGLCDRGDLLRARLPPRGVVVRRGLAPTPEVHQKLLVRLQRCLRRHQVLLVLHQLLLHLGQRGGLLIDAGLGGLDLPLLGSAEALEGDLGEDVLLLGLRQFLLHVLPHRLENSQDGGAPRTVRLCTGGGAHHGLLAQVGDEAASTHTREAAHQIPHVLLRGRREGRPVPHEGGPAEAVARRVGAGVGGCSAAGVLRRLRDQVLHLRHRLGGRLRLAAAHLQQARARGRLRQDRDGLLQKRRRLHEVALEGDKLLLRL
mmetsp:Transcript_2505/g.7127  ORF Transcript_2505/g.7127 Transcript_2505/m.7127 type:complete len:307 (+) Transcript_2505:951-1871(+)